MGAKNLANVTELHIITNAKQRNHFMKLKLYTRMSLNPTMIKKKGIRNAGNPKFSVMKK